ncbi:MAG: tRNA (adenosine(37)-N6)-threonylcarbamoyltransferase complex ATPase subunit type 1 TsaE [Oscillospiraceae bacterium]
MKHTTVSPEETEALGEKLAGRLKKGSVVALYGGLGAGKTAFVRGIARGMGLNARVTSPTFTIVNEYQDRLFHFDLYRINSFAELVDIGWDEYTERGVCAVEWSENAPELENIANVRVKIALRDENEREIIIEGAEDI